MKNGDTSVAKSDARDPPQAQLGRFEEPEGVDIVGVAPEKISTLRTEKRRNPETGASYPWIVRASAIVTEYYMYGLDLDFGPFFVKFSSYFRTGRSCASTAITGRNAKPTPRGSRSPRWTTGFWSARRPSGCSGSATGCQQGRSTRSFAAGWRGCAPTRANRDLLSGRSLPHQLAGQRPGRHIQDARVPPHPRGGHQQRLVVDV